MLPLAQAPSWFVEHLYVLPNSKIVILDDDASIHQIWSGRFEKVKAKNAGVEILHFSAPQQLTQWVKSNVELPTEIIYLVDYEFQGTDQVGLDVIENLGIESQSILVTSRYEEFDLRQRCERLTVKLIPKDLAAYVPIRIRPIT